MASSVEVSVFVDTNLDTHIAVAISPDIITWDFKRELEREHFICFPKLGEIRVLSLMVRRRSNLYHLPDPMPVKCAFQEWKGVWFLCMEASPINDSCIPISSENFPAEVSDCFPSGSIVTDSLEIKCGNSFSNMENAKTKYRKTKRKRSIFVNEVLKDLLTPVCISKKKRKRNMLKVKQEFMLLVDETEEKCLRGDEYVLGVSTKERFRHLSHGNVRNQSEEWSSQSVVERPSASSPVLSVTDIITRYFPYTNDLNQINDFLSSDIRDEYNAYRSHVQESWKTEMKEHCSIMQVGNTHQYNSKMPQGMSSLPLHTDSKSQLSRLNLGSTEVGKRLVLAAENLGISGSKKKKAIHLFTSKIGELLVPSPSQQIKNSVYDIRDSGE